MKKNKKTIQDNANSAKVIPPYPRWVKICCAIVYWLIAIVVAIVVVGLVLDFRISVVSVEELFFDLLMGSLFLAMLLIGGYGIYRAFRYFPKRAFCVLALVVMSEVLAQIYSIKLSYSRTIICLIPLGLILGQGILALFWEKARKWGWSVYLMALLVVLVVTGHVYNRAMLYLNTHEDTYIFGTDEDNR